MKKLSEIKTGEKFEYDERFYMGMEVDSIEEGTFVKAIDLETGRRDEAVDSDSLVEPLLSKKLKIMVDGDYEINGMVLYGEDAVK